MRRRWFLVQQWWLVVVMMSRCWIGDFTFLKMSSTSLHQRENFILQPVSTISPSQKTFIRGIASQTWWSGVRVMTTFWWWPRRCITWAWLTLRKRPLRYISQTSKAAAPVTVTVTAIITGTLSKDTLQDAAAVCGRPARNTLRSWRPKLCVRLTQLRSQRGALNAT